MKQDEIGIEPNHILAYGWLEQKGFRQVQGMTYEDQLGAYKQDWFHTLLRFQELTASRMPFDAEDFESFIAEASQKRSPHDAYRMIIDRTLKNVSGLANKYAEQEKEQRVGALWSGNTVHEITGLTELRPAETAIGRRHRAEALLPDHQRITGD